MVDEKGMAGDAAAELVRPGMRLGLGTGSTAARFVEALGRRIAGGLSVVGVPTSEATRRQAEALGIPLTTLDETPELDLTVDGADEIGPDLALIKGGGGALLREKLVAAASRRVVIVADSAKRVPVLGRFPLPIEVVPFAFETTRRRIDSLLSARAGRPIELSLRRGGDGATFVTDGGNWIVDARLGAIADPEVLGPEIKALVGVVEHGLFTRLADAALIGTAGGVMEIASDDPPARGRKP